MDKFVRVTSRAVPMLRRDVDTDLITPMRRIGLAQPQPLHHYAFEALRYVGGDGDTGAPNPEFELNQDAYAGARIMLTGANFGCGSSRETAPQAIAGLGFRCLIGTSFGDIFFKNCFQQGILPVVLAEAELDALAKQARDGEFSVDLETCTITAPDRRELRFEVNPLRRESLLSGLDDIGLTLQRGDAIAAFQARDRVERPWVYAAGVH